MNAIAAAASVLTQVGVLEERVDTLGSLLRENKLIADLPPEGLAKFLLSWWQGVGGVDAWGRVPHKVKWASVRAFLTQHP